MNTMLNFQNAHKMKSNIWLLPVIITLTSCGAEADNAGASTQNVIPVDVAVVKQQTISDKINSSGNLLPWETATLRSRAAGEITDIYFDEGQRVKKNQKLIQLDDRSLKAQLRRLRSNLKTAENELDRNKNLREVEGVSQGVLDESENRVETLKAEIDEIEVMLDFTTIKAPFEGSIGLRNVSPGDYLSVGESIGQIVAESTLRLKFNIPGQYSQAIKTGDSVYFEIRGRDSLYTAKVFAREAQISSTSRNLEVLAEVDNAAGDLVPGAFARVFVTIQTHDGAKLVPSESITSNIKGQTLWMMKNGKAHNVEVKPGLRLSKTTQILSGVDSGDTVLTTGLLQVREGTPVKVKEIIKIDQN